MKKAKLPDTDSIQEPKFWDAHDATDFEDELEEVSEPVFIRDAAITLHLEPRDAEAIREIARSRGLEERELIRGWILEKLQAK